MVNLHKRKPFTFVRSIKLYNRRLWYNLVPLHRCAAVSLSKVAEPLLVQSQFEKAVFLDNQFLELLPNAAFLKEIPYLFFTEQITVCCSSL